MKNEYANDLYIDDSALDVEWLNQSSLMLKYTSKQAAAKRECDRAQENLSLIKAELDKKVRKDPEKYKLDKVVNETVFTVVVSQKKYKEANENLINAQYEYQMAQGAVKAVEHKKSALENLSKLLGMNYFAGPSVPRDLNKEAAKRRIEEKANKNIKIKRK